VDKELVSVLNHQGVALHISEEHADLLGWEPKEFIGRSVFEFVHPEDLERVLSLYQSMVETNQATPCTFRFQHKEGHWVKFSSKGMPILEDGMCKGFIIVSRNMQPIDLQRIAAMIDIDLLPTQKGERELA
jgi:PAS domain S-box-containing protein